MFSAFFEGFEGVFKIGWGGVFANGIDLFSRLFCKRFNGGKKVFGFYLVEREGRKRRVVGGEKGVIHHGVS